MEKKTLTLDSALPTRKAALPLSQRLLSSRPVLSLTRAYAEALGRRLTPRQALHLTHVQAAAALLLVPQVPSAAYYALMAAWFILALKGCCRSFAKKQR